MFLVRFLCALGFCVMDHERIATANKSSQTRTINSSSFYQLWSCKPTATSALGYCNKFKEPGFSIALLFLLDYNYLFELFPNLTFRMCFSGWKCIGISELFFFFFLFPTSKDSLESSVYIRCSILRYLMRIYNFHVLILEFSLIVLFLMPMSFSSNDTSSLCRKVEGSSPTGCVYN